MNVMDEGQQRHLVALLRGSDLNNADLLFKNLLQLAYSEGVADGAKEMATRVVAVLEAREGSPVTPPVPLVVREPAPTEDLERDIRSSVLAKFRPRGDLEPT